MTSLYSNQATKIISNTACMRMIASSFCTSGRTLTRPGPTWDVKLVVTARARASQHRINRRGHVSSGVALAASILLESLTPHLSLSATVTARQRHVVPLITEQLRTAEQGYGGASSSFAPFWVPAGEGRFDEQELETARRCLPTSLPLRMRYAISTAARFPQICFALDSWVFV